MVKCLVTRLKESVNDDSLLKLGEIRVRFENGCGLEFNNPNYGNETIVLKAINGTYFNDGDTELSVKLNNKGYFLRVIQTNNELGYVDVSIPNKYAVALMNNMNNKKVTLLSDISCLYSKSLISPSSNINLNGYVIHEMENLINFGGIYYSLIENLDLSMFNGYDFPKLMIITGQFENCKGDISDLGELITLTEFSSKWVRPTTTFKGTAESLAKKMVLNGRISGTLKLEDIWGNGIKVFDNDISIGVGTWYIHFSDSYSTSSEAVEGVVFGEGYAISQIETAP